MSKSVYKQRRNLLLKTISKTKMFDDINQRNALSVLKSTLFHFFLPVDMHSVVKLSPQFPQLIIPSNTNKGKCILGQWEKKPEEQITCPLCRRQMSILIKDFKVPSNANADPTLKKVLEGVRKYNDKFSGKPRTVIIFLRSRINCSLIND